MADNESKIEALTSYDTEKGTYSFGIKATGNLKGADLSDSPTYLVHLRSVDCVVKPEVLSFSKVEMGYETKLATLTPYGAPEATVEAELRVAKTEGGVAP